jgi:26S proteasome regulatory subunit N3
MADKMDIDAVNGEKQAESVGPASTLPPEKGTLLTLLFEVLHNAT